MGLAEWVSSALDAFGNVYSFEYSPEMVTVRDSSKVEQRFVEQSGVNVSFRERERGKNRVLGFEK